ncbi:MAG TPA: hypothetical protein VI957_03605 [Candidatus Paceibacterota bacterium]
MSQEKNSIIPYDENPQGNIIKYLEKGDFETMIACQTIIFLGLLTKSLRSFNVEKFRAGRQKSGQAFPDARERDVESRVQDYLNQSRTTERLKAAETAHVLGRMWQIIFEREAAKQSFGLAILLDPGNPEYKSSLEN